MIWANDEQAACRAVMEKSDLGTRLLKCVDREIIDMNEAIDSYIGKVDKPEIAELEGALNAYPWAKRCVGLLRKELGYV